MEIRLSNSIQRVRFSSRRRARSRAVLCPKLLRPLSIFGLADSALDELVELHLHPLDGLRVQLTSFLQVVDKIVEPQHNKALRIRGAVLVQHDHRQPPVLRGGLRLLHGVLYPGGELLAALALYREGRMLDVRAVPARPARDGYTLAAQKVGDATLASLPILYETPSFLR